MKDNKKSQPRKQWIELTKQEQNKTIIIIAVIIFGLLLAIIIVSSIVSTFDEGTSSTNNNQKGKQISPQQDNKSEPTKKESKPTIKVPSYKVASTNNERFDGAKNYLVVLDSFGGDYENARDYAKGVVVDLVSKNDKKLSTLVFANQDAYSAYLRKNDTSNLCYGQCLTDVGIILEAGFIAWYDGFIEANTSEHYISYFPGSFTGNPIVGKYVGSEDFVAENYDPLN